MKFLNKTYGLTAMIFLSLLPSALTFAIDKETYSLGVFPYNSTRQIMNIYGPVALDLGAAIKSKLNLKTTSSFAKFSRNMETEIYDIALIQPFDYINAINKYQYTPLARLDAPLSAYFAVLDDSNIHKLGDLQDKVIALPPLQAAISHLAKSELMDAGIALNNKTKIKHQKNHDSCLHEVLIHRAVVCATDFTNIIIFERKHKIKLRIIKKSRTLPHVLFVAHKRVPKNIRVQMKNQIISWNKTKSGKALLKKMGIPGFVNVKNDDYAIMFTLSNFNIIQKKHSVTNGFSLGILPYFPAKKLSIRFAPITESFSEALNNRPVIFRTASSYEQFHNDIKNGVYDIILTQPYDYNAAVNQGYIPVAQISYDIQATFYINRNTNIKSFNDLIGKTVASAPWHAATSRLFNEKVRQSGLWVGKDIFVEYKTSHFQCFQQLYDKNVSACVSGPLILSSVPFKLSENVIAIDKTQAIPGLLFMIHSRVNKQDRQKLKKTILDWRKNPAGQNLLRHSKLKYFKEIDKSRYEALNTRND